ncbi:MAG: hypothetical protein JWR85_4026 [Marmoricola sp.]|jgi:hypothetical protein|nr:hypothetical protein [Marmoricola sp.]
MSKNVYTLAKAKELASGAFYAEIKLNGKLVGEVSNDGRGGCDRYSFKDRENRELFTKTAQELMGESEPGAEVEDKFVTRLFLVHGLNSVRTGLVAVSSPEDYWENGRYTVLKRAGVTKAQIIEAVKAQSPDRIVWNKDTQEFVPAHTL